MQGEVKIDPTLHQVPTEGGCARQGCGHKATCQPHARIYRDKLSKLQHKRFCSFSFNVPLCPEHIKELIEKPELLFTPDLQANIAKDFYAKKMPPPDMRTIEVFAGPMVDTRDPANAALIGTRQQ